MYRFALIFIAALSAFTLSAQEQEPLDKVKELIDQQSFGVAKAQLAVMISEDPKEPELHYWLGKVYFEEEAYDRAQTTFEAGIDIKNNFYLNRVGLSRVLSHTGDKTGAIALLKKVQEDMEYWGKEDKEVDYEMASAYQDAGKFKEAEVLLYQLQAVENQNPRSYIALGDYYMAKDLGSLAMNQYEQAIKLDANYIPGYMRIGKLKIEAKAYEEGARMLTKAIELDPEYAPSFRERGELYFRARQYDKARGDYQKYVELTGNDLAARHRLAEFLFLTDNFDETIAELEAIDTTTNVKLRLLAYSYEKTDKPELAIEKLDTYFSRMNPEYTIASDYEVYGKALLKSDKVDKAQEYFKQAIERDPERVVLYRNLAREYKAQKDYPMEARYRDLYLNAKPEKKHNNYYNLGIALYRSQEYSRAFEVFSAASKLKEDHVNTYNWLMRIGSKLEAVDTTSMDWLAIPAAEKVLSLIGEKAEADFEKGEKTTLNTALQILAFHAFDPLGEGANDCEATKPYLNRALELDAENEGLQQIRRYCEALGGN